MYQGCIYHRIDIVGNMLNEVAYNGGSWTQLSNENKPLVDAIIDKYKG